MLGAKHRTANQTHRNHNIRYFAVQGIAIWCGNSFDLLNMSNIPKRKSAMPNFSEHIVIQCLADGIDPNESLNYLP